MNKNFPLFEIMIQLVLAFGVAFILNIFLIPLIRNVSARLGYVKQPKQDRWHKKPTSEFGGIGIFIAFLVAVLASSWQEGIPWGLLSGSALIFAIGLIDDIRPLTPPIKFMGQLAAASLVVFSGYHTNFFSGMLPNVMVSIVWLVGISNAINLLDNMDGLAGGISFIAAGFLAVFFWGPLGSTNSEFLFIALALAGSLLGFLLYNFPPASIFMGDSGALFIGFTLASLAIARQPKASNIFAVMSVPTLVFLLPILDTTLVTLTRLLRGQSPAQGGKDHTSHRLVAFGLTERQAVIVLYLVAFISGIVSTTVESIDYDLGLVLLPILIMAFALLAAYLSRIKVVEGRTTSNRVFTNIILDLTYKRRIFELGLDFFIISIAYYMAFLTQNGFSLDQVEINKILSQIPFVLGVAYLNFFLFGVYRGVWQYFGLGDLVRLIWAVCGTVVFVWVLFAWILNLVTISSAAIFLFGVFLLVGVAAARSSFKILDQLISRQIGQDKKSERKNVVIFGADDDGEITLRWITLNPDLGYHLVGFLDNDTYKWGRNIHGLEVLGGQEQLSKIIQQKQVDGMILTSSILINEEIAGRTIEICEQNGVWVRKLQLALEMLSKETNN